MCVHGLNFMTAFADDRDRAGRWCLGCLKRGILLAPHGEGIHRAIHEVRCKKESQL